MNAQDKKIYIWSYHFTRSKGMQSSKENNLQRKNTGGNLEIRFVSSLENVLKDFE